MGVNCKRRKRNEGRKKIVFTQKWIGDAVKKFLQEEDIYESDMERIKYMRIGDCDFGGDYTIEMSTATLPDPLMEQKRLLREEFRRKMNRDNVNLAERLITQAKKAAELIKDEISVLCYEKLCSTITICQNYVKGETDLSWIDVYDEIYHGEGEEGEEDGIYLMSQYIDIPDEVALLMALPIEILSYVCWLGCKAENDYFPQDLELVIGDKIPDFLSFLEENLAGKEDFKQAIEFVNKNMCY